MGDEKSKRVETLAARVDEVSGESMNARHRLEGIERRVGMEGQQQQATVMDLRVLINAENICKALVDAPPTVRWISSPGTRNILRWKS